MRRDSEGPQKEKKQKEEDEEELGDSPVRGPTVRKPMARTSEVAPKVDARFSRPMNLTMTRL